jgi:hypothetical protein
MVLASVRRSAGAWASSRAPQAHLRALIIITSVGSPIIRIEPSGDRGASRGAAPDAVKPGEISLLGHAPGAPVLSAES